MSETEKTPTNLYPTFSINRITNPNRLYAVPLFGFIIKIIMIIPQCIEMFFLGMAAFFIIYCINPFVVLFTGKYWEAAYQLNIGVMKLYLKMTLFIYGLTNTYPGFDFTIHDNYTIEIPKPEHPNRLFAIPLLGGLARIILLIPFTLYESVIRYAAFLGIIGGSFPVLFKGYYPETTYELARDAVRLNMSLSMYFSGLSDTYPSFWISMNHKALKWFLIILAILFSLLNSLSGFTQKQPQFNEPQYMMNQQKTMMPDSDNDTDNTNTPSDLKTGN